MATGRVTVVGIGPGARAGMTGQALAALSDAEVLCGYAGYIELVVPLFPGKRVISTGMTRETERCRAALAEAASGRRVAVVSSGDSGVYGMAGLVFELSEGYPAVEIEVVPGVSAALSGAALLGAPLMHDFAVLSLSDLLTPREVIEKRLRAAAAADFVLCLYNPASKKRHDYLRRAADIVMEYRAAATVCGWTRNIGRDGEDWGVVSLDELAGLPVDMFVTVFVGSSSTRELRGRMVTPRGYVGLTP